MNLRDLFQTIMQNAKYEDESFVGNPKKLNQFSPANADVKNFETQPQGMYEDEGLVDGPQGFSPISADIRNFKRPQNFNQRQPQYEDGSPLYEVQPNVNPMFRGGFDPQQEYRDRLRVR